MRRDGGGEQPFKVQRLVWLVVVKRTLGHVMVMLGHVMVLMIVMVMMIFLLLLAFLTLLLIN